MPLCFDHELAERELAEQYAADMLGEAYIEELKQRCKSLENKNQKLKSKIKALIIQNKALQMKIVSLKAVIEKVR
jgi:regulator of replication initiation timing